MGRTPAENTPNLRLNVAAPPNWTFAAGDTVIGSVVRRSSIVAPDAKVTISLHGRVKTKITIHRSQGGTDYYRGRWQLLRKSHILFHGPMHLSPQSARDDVLSWPFSITIPEKPDPSVTTGHFRAESFVPFDCKAETQCSLPGSCFMEYKHFGGNSSEGFVEYYLEATLHHTRGSSYKNHTATMPIALRPPKPFGSGFSGYGPKRHMIEQHVRSQRLLPGMEHAELSFKQKTQKVLHMSKVPVFHFGVEVGSVNTIQLDHPVPIPFTLRIVSRDYLTSPIIRDVPQGVRLNWVKLTIKAENKVLAPGNWIETVHDDHYSDKLSLGLERVFRRLDSPVILTPCGGGNGTDEKNRSDEKNLVNLGNMFQLVLTSRGLTAGGKLLNPLPGLYPDFVTYNIRHRNCKLDWAICLTVVDETVMVTPSTPLRILAAE